MIYLINSKLFYLLMMVNCAITLAACSDDPVDSQDDTSIDSKDDTSVDSDTECGQDGDTCSESPTTPSLVMTTDKTQYTASAMANLQVINNLENSIWYIGYSQPELVFWTIELNTNDDWSRVDFSLPVTQDGAEVCRIAHYEQPIGEVTELKPNSELFYEWNQKICVFKSPTEETVPEMIERGTYRFVLHYSFDTVKTETTDTDPLKRPIELGEIKVIHSNEFVLE